MLKLGLIGLGKMGLSHMAIVNAHPDVDLVCVCDTTDYVLDVIKKYTGKRVYTDYAKMLDSEQLDAVLVSTPSKFHADMVRACIDKGLHVFCEKPFVLDPAVGMELAELAAQRKLVNQVGYHYRFVESFAEVRRLLDMNLIGKVHNVRAEAYGPVVLRDKGGTWRSSKSEGGGCLYDYACHAIDLMNYLVGTPESISAAKLNRIFSTVVDDEVYALFNYANGASGVVNANWSDESNRKMSTKVTLWGTNGKIYADRQEIQVYLRDAAGAPAGYGPGWTVRYTTDMTKPVWFYLRGEEYSAQIDHFIQNVKTGNLEGENSFRSAVDTDLVAAGIVSVAQSPAVALQGMTAPAVSSAAAQPNRRSLRSFFGGGAR